MNRDKSHLADVASLLLGERWQRPLARLLRVDSRLVRRWACGERPIPLWVFERLKEELNRTQGKIETMISTMEDLP